MKEKSLVGKIAHIEDCSVPVIILGTGKLYKEDSTGYIVADIQLESSICYSRSWNEVVHLRDNIISCDYIVTKEEFELLSSKYLLFNIGWDYSKGFTLWPFKKVAIFQLPYQYEQ